MNEYQHTEALVRILAFMAAGNTESAEKVLQWAYSTNSPKRDEKKERRTARKEEKAKKTDEFIKRYLNPETKISPESIARFISKYIDGNATRDLNKTTIKKFIVDLPYEQFLKTIYWTSISSVVKARAGKKCAICGRTDKLQVHHTTYAHHGEEIKHIGDLICVCPECHEIIHNK